MIDQTVQFFKQHHISDTFTYFPTVRQREKWNSVPEDVQARIIGDAERLTERVWESLPATRYLDYTRNGDRSRFQDAFYAKRKDLMILTLAECIENTGRFVDPVIDGIWSICEETSWCVPAHNSGYQDGKPRSLPEPDEPIIDLFAAQTAAAMSAVLCLLESVIDGQEPQVTERMRREVHRRVVVPFLERDDFWWMGFTDRAVNNWNPWIISNILICLSVVETDRKSEGFIKAVRCLDKFLGEYTDDGGCDEGSSYWGRAGGSLFDCADILFEATDGAVDWFSEPKIREIGRFITHAHIDGDYYVNFADGPGTLKHHSPQLIYRYGKRIGDTNMQALAVSQYKAHGMGFPDQSALRSIPALFLYQELGECTLEYRPEEDVWLPGIQFMTHRRRQTDGTEIFVAAKAGNNAESHNHNDVGNFIVYLGGRPAIIDAGVGTYTAKTFSDRRYDIWYMRSDYHNVPTVNGVCQIHGAEAGKAGGIARAATNAEASYNRNGQYVTFTSDLLPFYPEEAGMKSLSRTLMFDIRLVRLTDSYRFDGGENTVVMQLLTVKKPDAKETVLTIPVPDSTTLRCRCDATYQITSIEELLLEDERLSSVWGKQIYRTILSASLGDGERSLTLEFSPDS